MKPQIHSILDKIPKLFFNQIEEGQTAAFQEALKQNVIYDKSEQTSMLGHNRHALCEREFRNAALANNLEVKNSPTNPIGGTYSWINVGNIYILRANVPYYRGTPRISKYRKVFAEFNRFLDPCQSDLFDNFPEPPSDKICGMIVTVAHKKNQGNLGIPSYLGFGIPNPR